MSRIALLLVVASSIALAVSGCSSSETNGVSGAGASGPAPGCHGDESAWESAIAPVACSKHSDCCVIVNACTNQAQVVFSENRQSGKASWPYCDKDCTNCLAPAVDVYCVSGACVGYVHDGFTNVENHCGFDGADDPMFDKPNTAFGCGM